MAGAREFIELCDSGNAPQNKGEMLAMLLQVEQQTPGNAAGYKVTLKRGFYPLCLLIH
jgi:hypothetical protein